MGDRDQGSGSRIGTSPPFNQGGDGGGRPTGGPNAGSCITKSNGFGKCFVLCGPQCAENNGACVAKFAPCKRCTSKNPRVKKSWCVNYCSHVPLECPASECHKCKDAC